MGSPRYLRGYLHLLKSMVQWGVQCNFPTILKQNKRFTFCDNWNFCLDFIRGWWWISTDRQMTSEINKNLASPSSVWMAGLPSKFDPIAIFLADVQITIPTESSPAAWNAVRSPFIGNVKQNVPFGVEVAAADMREKVNNFNNQLVCPVSDPSGL